MPLCFTEITKNSKQKICPFYLPSSQIIPSNFPSLQQSQYCLLFWGLLSILQQRSLFQHRFHRVLIRLGSNGYSLPLSWGSRIWRIQRQIQKRSNLIQLYHIHLNLSRLTWFLLGIRELKPSIYLTSFRNKPCIRVV